MSIKKTIALIFVFLIFINSGKAQKWVEMMQDPKSNFYDVVKEFESYWKDRPYERGKGYNSFRRWQWFMEPRVYPSGELKYGSHAYAIEQYKNFIIENASAKQSTNAVISATTANWIPLGPFGSPANGDAGRIQVIEMHPVSSNTFYVGTSAGGFWITNNGGVSYTTTTDQLGSCGVSDIAINPLSPNIIYISTGDKDGGAGDTQSIGVLKSTDGGLTWNTTGLTWQASQYRRIYSLLINPVNPNILIVATSQGMYRTIDAGVTWSVTANGYYVDAEFRPGDPTVVHAVSNTGYIKSTDGGVTYTAIPVAGGTNSNRLNLAVSQANSNYLYIIASNNASGYGGVYRSTNAGATFSLMSSTPNIFNASSNGSGTGGNGWYDIAIDASPTNANEITAGGVNSWKSLDGGATWVLNTHWTGTGAPYVHADLHSVVYTSSTTCYLGTDGGVARSTDGGATWITINGSMNISQIYKMGFSANNYSLILTGHQDNGSNLWDGTSWTSIYGGDGTACFVDWNTNTTMVYSWQNGNFRRSFNGGASSQPIVTGLTGSGAWVAPIVQSPTDPNVFYCGYQNVFKSTNQGSSWTQVGNIGGTLDEIRISPSNTNIIYATTSNAVYKTMNDGGNWTNIAGSIPSGSASISDLAIDNTNSNKIYVTLSGYYSGNKVFMSNNGGLTWTNYSTGLPNIPVNCIRYKKNSPQITYIGTELGVYYREASMASWMPYSTGLPNVVINDIDIYYPTGKLRAATFARGVWEADLYSSPGTAPAAAFGTQFVPACINTPLQFNDYSGNTPTSWTWTFTGGSPATSTLQNPSITYPATGIYTVTLVSANGNGTSTPYSSTISVVNAPTVAPSSNSVCNGQSGNISAITNGNTVVWPNFQQGFSIGVSPTVTTVYNYTSSAGACNTVGTATMVVDNAPGTPTVIVIGNYLTTTTVAQSYQWYLGGSPIPGETAVTYTPVIAGLYAVSVANGMCSDFSDVFNVTDIGLKEISVLSGLKVGPNPVKDYIELTLANACSEEINYEIQNNLGQIVTRSKFKIDENKQAKLNIQSLASGVYYLNLKKGEIRNSYKFIK